MPYKDKEKKRQNMAKWRKAHPDRVRDMHVKQKYGITFEEVEILRGQQGNCCALCDKKFLSTPCVDHCHKTGKVRGLLCVRCNSALGDLERPGWLPRAVKYLGDKSSNSNTED
jgi:hypothetical protein